MAKKSRRDPKEEQFLILRKLASGGELKRRDFEEPKRRLKEVKEKLEFGKNRSKYVPHSSLILRLDELVESHAIMKQNSGEESKKGLPIKEYYLTLFGFIRLLQLCEEEKFYSDIFKNSSRHLPKIIWFQIEKLLEIKMLSKEHLFFILVEIAKNTDIQIDFDPRNHPGIIGNRIYRMSSSLLMKDVKWIHVYDVEIKIKQIENVYPIHKTFITSGKTRSEKDKKQKDAKYMGDINKMFIFAFVNELIMRCYRLDGKYSKYITPDEAPFLLEILRFDNLLKRIYFDFVDDILYQQGIERDTILNVQKSLRSKRSLISRKKLK